MDMCRGVVVERVSCNLLDRATTDRPPKADWCRIADRPGGITEMMEVRGPQSDPVG
jgi:hypothetical protein